MSMVVLMADSRSAAAPPSNSRAVFPTQSETDELAIAEAKAGLAITTRVSTSKTAKPVNAALNIPVSR